MAHLGLNLIIRLQRTVRQALHKLDGIVNVVVVVVVETWQSQGAFFRGGVSLHGCQQGILFRQVLCPLHILFSLRRHLNLA